MPRRRIPSVLLLAVLAPALFIVACDDDPVVPRVSREIRVERARFFSNDVSIGVGGKIRWVNILARSAENRRTVTSGTGPDDHEAGDLFDTTLEGHPSGEAEGQDFIFQFNETGEYRYFSRLPSGEEFTGIVRVN